MARIAAVGDEPIVFFTEDGKQVFLPLSDIYFDGGVAGSESQSSTALGRWLHYLVAQGLLVPASTPSPGPAMVATAAKAGSTGNGLVVEVTPNGATKVDIRVTETDIYEGLTLDSAFPNNYVEKVLGVTGAAGAAGTAGKRPGLVRVQPISGTPPDPKEGVIEATVTPITLVGPATGNTPEPPSFTLEARGTGSDTGEPQWTVEVTDVQPTSGRNTFTLKVTWTNKVTVAAADLADPASKLAPLAFAVVFTKPAGSTELKLPKPGSVHLRGGAEAADATKARATLLANA